MGGIAPPRTIVLGEHRLSRIGLGTNRLTDTAENRSFLEAAVAAGLNFIDTAHLYTGGESERTIGAALTPLPEGVVVATKGGYHPGGGSEGLRAELEQSFERLGTETISLYYLHRVDPDVPIEETMGVLKKYVDAGRIAHVGLSEVSVEQIQRAGSVVPISAVQNEYSLAERMWDDVVDHCEGEGIVSSPSIPCAGAIHVVWQRSLNGTARAPVRSGSPGRCRGHRAWFRSPERFRWSTCERPWRRSTSSSRPRISKL